MKLLKFKVNNYKTIENSGWITTNEITCLVGENESGKTNILTALLKLNPADKDTKIDLLSDYPRQKYTEERNIASTKKFIEAIFEIDEPYSYQQIDENKEEDNCKIESFKYIRVERYYSSEYKVYGIKEESEIDDNEKQIEFNKEAVDEIINMIPKFVYYASYASLNSEIYLPNIISNLDRYNTLTEKERNKVKTLKVLFNYVNLSAKEILELGREGTSTKNETEIEKEAKNKREREIMLTSASGRFTASFKEWWKQGNYKFRFSVDGNYFRIWVSDNVRAEEIELENRSSGLQWFFSFFLVFITEDGGENHNSIILLDEPGHTLHPMAQKDLSNFFNSLSQKNQLMYTTHSPFLVDSMNITNTKVVYSDENGVTNVSDDLKIQKKTAQKSIYPINSAIGITISDTMLIGTKPIIVEGVSDQIYMTHIKRKLMKLGKFSSTEELVFMPVDGTSNIKPVVSILSGRENELPIVIIDNDQAGRDKQKSLEKGLYSTEPKKIINIKEYVIKAIEDAEIEDIMDPLEIQESFNKEFKNNEEDFIYDKDDKNSIVKQIESFCKEYGYKLDVGWKVIIARKYIQRNSEPTKELIEKWEKLFNKIA